MRDYIDPSAVVPLLIAEPASGAIEAFLLAATDEHFVSEFTAAEVAAVLSRLLRMQHLTAIAAAGKLADFEAWRGAAASSADIQSSDARLAYNYVGRFELKLRAPDALHLAIARRLDAKLVTLDRRLASAAEALGIPALIPGAS